MTATPELREKWGLVGTTETCRPLSRELLLQVGVKLWTGFSCCYRKALPVLRWRMLQGWGHRDNKPTGWQQEIGKNKLLSLLQPCHLHQDFQVHSLTRLWLAKQKWDVECRSPPPSAKAAWKSGLQLWYLKPRTKFNMISLFELQSWKWAFLHENF